MNHVQHRAVGIITAQRAEYHGGLKDAEGRTNKQRNAALATDIRNNGFGFTHLRGRYVENYGTKQATPSDEHSFMIVSDSHKKLRDFLTTHGEKYGQDSVLFKHPKEPSAKLIGTKEGAYPGKGQEQDVGEFHANRVPEFHTLLTRGGGADKPGKTPAAKKSFAFMNANAAAKPDLQEDAWGGAWETFGFYNPVTFSSRRETIF